MFTAEIHPWEGLVPTVPDRGYQDELTEEWTVEWKMDGRSYRFTVPKGYTFSPSIPGIFFPLLPTSRFRHASAPHDWAYFNRGDVEAEVKENGEWKSLGRPLTRKEVDRAFIIHAAQVAETINARYGERVAEVKSWQLGLAYIGVRAGGWFLWYDWPQKLGLK